MKNEICSIFADAMKFGGKLLFILFFCAFADTILAQNIAVDDTYSAQQLVEDVLINSTCANVTNFSVSGDTFSAGQQSYGYFSYSGANFFSTGIVLSTSRANRTAGPNNNLIDEGATSWLGDFDVEQALSLQSNSTFNATSLEFDFTPLTSQISFDYIFASEEYQGTAPCRYSDGFSFLLKIAGSQDQYENLALIPNSATPVKVTTVHPVIAGGNGCPAINEEYFGSYNGNVHPINFNGQTVVMTAQADVIPGTTYHIKLVIADEENIRYDSAIFLSGGSFAVGTDLGSNRLIATDNPICVGEIYTLDATEPGNNSYQWFKNGVTMAGEINPIYTVTTSGIYKVEITLNATTCVAIGEITIEYVNPPTLINPVTLIQCDDNNDGISTFDLSKVSNLITQGNTQLNAVNYYENQYDAENQLNVITNPTLYQNTVTNQLTARVTNAFGCASYSVVNLQIANNTMPTINPIAVCDEDGTFDGVTTTNLNQTVTPEVLNGLPNGLMVEYYLSNSDAVLQINSLSNNFINTNSYFQTIFARIINGSDCYGITPVQLQIIVFNPPNFRDEVVILCEGETGILSVNNGFSSYLWNTGATTSSIAITSAGNYTVTVFNSIGCEVTKNFTVIASSSPTITSIVINDFSEDNNTIQINVTGNGDYEYSLDGLNFQNDSFFSNVISDEYFVHVRDKNGCNPIAIQHIYVLNYPKYFTPNGDGIHDMWNVKNLNFYSNATITIFDRFGKLIASFNQNQPGWDGKMNDKELFASDYWFVISLDNGRTIKGHFALKR